MTQIKLVKNRLEEFLNLDDFSSTNLISELERYKTQRDLHERGLRQDLITTRFEIMCRYSMTPEEFKKSYKTFCDIEERIGNNHHEDSNNVTSINPLRYGLHPEIQN